MWNLVVLNLTTDVLTWEKTKAPLYLGFSNSFNVVVLKFQQKLSERKQKLFGVSFVCLLRSSESLRQVNWFVGIYLGLSAHEKYFSLWTSFMCLQLFFLLIPSAVLTLSSLSSRLCFSQKWKPSSVTSPPHSGSLWPWKHDLWKFSQSRFKPG